ncbi:hypothetical protein TIFTF001_029937 [Ficus carica]|uniref:Uncharacterized protein n=1 Tax=Ficus carica TaxID=3494 RepID=A0AA88J245_FICCA|nr:hypothetical protein TIFTF001_029937 [Ficus carica]
MLSKFSRVIPTCTRTGLVHGLGWIGLAVPTTPWLRTTVSILLAILDARGWGMAGLTLKLWDGDRYTFYRGDRFQRPQSLSPYHSVIRRLALNRMETRHSSNRERTHQGEVDVLFGLSSILLLGPLSVSPNLWTYSDSPNHTSGFIISIAVIDTLISVISPIVLAIISLKKISMSDVVVDVLYTGVQFHVVFEPLEGLRTIKTTNRLLSFFRRFTATVIGWPLLLIALERDVGTHTADSTEQASFFLAVPDNCYLLVVPDQPFFQSFFGAPIHGHEAFIGSCDFLHSICQRPYKESLPVPHRDSDKCHTFTDGHQGQLSHHIEAW